MAGYWDMECFSCRKPTSWKKQRVCASIAHPQLTKSECAVLDPNWRESFAVGEKMPQRASCRRCSWFCEGCNEDVCYAHFNTAREFCVDCCQLLDSESCRDLVWVRDREEGLYHPSKDRDRWTRGKTALELIVLGRVPGQQKLTSFYQLVSPEENTKQEA